MKKLLVFFYLWTLQASAHLPAQQAELGVLLGGGFYSGDLSPKEFGIYFTEIKPALGLFYRFNTRGPLSLRAALSRTGLEADDRRRTGFEDRMFNFRTTVTELALTAEWKLFTTGSARGWQLSPFLFGGGGVYRFNPEVLFDGQWIAVQPLGTEGQGLPGYAAPYALTQWQLPLGMGVQLRYRRQMTITLELGGRRLFTDHLDDVSGAVVRYTDILNGNGALAAQISRPVVFNPDRDLTYRRGGDQVDWYYIGGITFAFPIGDEMSSRRLGCPTF